MEQTNMQLSIVVNMYNTASFLPRCMETLLDQDISPELYEIILVDDGSTDNSLELAQEYATQSISNAMMPTIRVEHHANKGLAGARNTGLKAATGKYLCFVDPDDFIEKNSLAALLQQMEIENLDILRFNYQKVDETGAYLPDVVAEKNFDYSSGVMTGVQFMQDRLTTCCYVWAYIYRLNLIRANYIWFDETCYFDDTPWLPRVLPLAERVNCIDARHLFYTQRSGSLVHTTSIESVKRKVEGQIRLLEILYTHKHMEEVHCWYKGMYSLIIISVLTSVAKYFYNQRNYYLKRIKCFDIWPLAQHRSITNSKRKINLINISPKLYIWLVHLQSLRNK